MRVSYPLLPAHRQAEARAIARRTHQTFLFAALTGVLVGLVVLGINRVTLDGLLDTLAEQPLWVQALAPAVGLVIAALCVRWITASTNTTTADEYVRSFHDQATERADPRAVVGRVLASIATIGYGGALGLEGPSIYAGSVIGASVQRRFARFFSREDAKLLLVAGTAAGVSAIFKAPATGALFAIEVPYRADVARRNVIPAMVAAATSYITFAAFDGTDPLLPMAGRQPFDWRDMAGALLVGLVCGVGARLFSAGLRALRTMPRIQRTPWPSRILIAGATLAVLAVVSNAAADTPLSLGPGYNVIEWATDPAHGAWLVLLILLVRVAAVMAAYGGGGVGGMFIPLVVIGALTGRVMGGAFGVSDVDLLVVVGMAAFLGAGYRTPLAALMFVAETTGRPGFVVPALVATAASQLVVGDSSVSVNQRAGRLGHLERRFELPISSVMSTDVRTVPPDATIEEFLSVHLVGQRRRSVPVVDETNRYLGLAVLDEVVMVRREAWATTDIRTIARTSAPRGRTTWLVRDAVGAMERADTDVLAIVDGDDRFVGVVTTDEVLRLDEILERTGLS
ncbi:MAG TPA: chloride channel protein [Acidimicrobiales bacterium]|nr:chloride channel protein [Acidimicrobiales bacterium]